VVRVGEGTPFEERFITLRSFLKEVTGPIRNPTIVMVFFRQRPIIGIWCYSLSVVRVVPRESLIGVPVIFFEPVCILPENRENVVAREVRVIETVVPIGELLDPSRFPQLTDFGIFLWRQFIECDIVWLVIVVEVDFARTVCSIPVLAEHPRDCRRFTIERNAVRADIVISRHLTGEKRCP
jgi:hypothetical protein